MAAAGAGAAPAPPAPEGTTLVCDMPLMAQDDAVNSAPVHRYQLVGKDKRPAKLRRLAWNCVGDCLACGMHSGAVVVLNTGPTGATLDKQLASTNCAEPAPVQGVAWHPSQERLLLSGGDDRLLRLWDMRKLSIAARHALPQSLTWAAFSPDGLYAAAGVGHGGAQLLDLRNMGKPLHALAAPAGVTVNNGVFGADGSLFLVGGHRVQHGLWAGGAWRLPEACTSAAAAADEPWLSHTRACRSAAVDASGSALALGSLDASVSVWDIAGGELVTTLGRPLLSVDALAWSPDGEYLAVASDQAPVEVVRVQDGSRIRTVDGTTISVGDGTADSKALAWAPVTGLCAAGGKAMGDVRYFRGGV